MKVLLLSLALLTFLPGAATRTSNVLLIVLDDVGQDSLSLYQPGPDVPRSPYWRPGDSTSRIVSTVASKKKSYEAYAPAGQVLSFNDRGGLRELDRAEKPGSPLEKYTRTDARLQGTANLCTTRLSPHVRARCVVSRRAEARMRSGVPGARRPSLYFV